MTKYKDNLQVIGNKVMSYNTHVATIEGNILLVHGWWSMTTSKHINYVANEFGLIKKNAAKKDENTNEDNQFKAVAMVAAMGEIFADTKEEKNNWKKRMLQAGIGNGLSLPEDWNTLNEDEKEKRLNAAIEIIS